MWTAFIREIQNKSSAFLENGYDVEVEAQLFQL